MKAVIIYFIFGGATQREAEQLAAELNAPLCRVKEAHNSSSLGFLSPEVRRKIIAIQPLDIDLNDYDQIKE